MNLWALCEAFHFTTLCTTKKARRHSYSWEVLFSWGYDGGQQWPHCQLSWVALEACPMGGVEVSSLCTSWWLEPFGIYFNSWLHESSPFNASEKDGRDKSFQPLQVGLYALPRVPLPHNSCKVIGWCSALQWQRTLPWQWHFCSFWWCGP